MPVRKPPIPLSWRGPESVAEIVRKLAKRKPVMLSLPHSFHHVLSVRLCDYARLHGVLDISGDSDLLGRLAEINGLHELAQLCEPVRLAGAGVQLLSPPPQVHLFFPKAGSKRVWHTHARRQPLTGSISIAARPPTASVSS